MLAILPFYIEKVLLLGGVQGGDELAILRLVRVIRVLRLFKLSRYSLWLQLVGESMKRSLRPVLGLLGVFMIMGLISASLMFYIEKEGDAPPFKNIPHTFYWAITTMTTVGYGDISPKTWGGEILAMVTMISGILLLALPVTVVGGNFQDVYAESEAKRNAKERFHGEDMVQKWDEAVAELGHYVDAAELTCQATTAKAYEIVQRLRAAQGERSQAAQ